MSKAGTSLPTEAVLLWVSSLIKRLPNRLQLGVAFIFERFHFVVLSISLAASVLSYWEVLPGIFQDEYIYSMESRKLAFDEQSYPNYLFSLLFQATSLCGDNFYQCSKGINTAVLAVFLGLFFLIARTIHSQRVAVLLTSVASLSGTTLYASFFMPEMLFYTLNFFAVWAALKASRTGTTAWWLVFSIGLGLAMLTKRHELFFLPGFAVAAFVILRGRSVSVSRAMALSVGFGLVLPVLIRQLGVFLIAGQPWASLLGSTYTDSFRESTDRGSGRPSPEIFDLISQGFVHLLLHAAVLMAMGLVLLRWSSLMPLKKPGLEAAGLDSVKTLSVIVISLAFSIVPIVAAFESYLTQAGDNHAFRLLARYYEFLFLLLLIVASKVPSLVSNRVKSRRRALVWASSFLVFVLLIGPLIETGPSDSPTIHGLKLIGPAILLFPIAVIWAFLPTKKARNSAIKILISAITVPILVFSSGLMARVDLQQTLGTNYSYFDVAGFFMKDNFPAAKGSEILVIGESRTHVVATKFAIDEPRVRHSIQPERSRSLNQNKLAGVNYVVVLYPTSFVTNVSAELLFEEPFFRVYKIK